MLIWSVGVAETVPAAAAVGLVVIPAVGRLEPIKHLECAGNGIRLREGGLGLMSSADSLLRGSGATLP